MAGSRYESPGRLGHSEARREAGEAVQHNDTDVNRGGLVPMGGVNDKFKGEDGKPIDPRRRIFLGKSRLGKRWSEVILAVNDGVFTWDEFVGTLSASELARGQLKDKGGRFRGRPPAFVPRGFHDACVAELLRRGKEEWQKAYLAAVKVMGEISEGEIPAKPADRIKAAQFIVERLEGKTPQPLEIKMSDPFTDMLAGAVASVEEDARIANAQDYMERMTDGAASPDAD